MTRLFLSALCLATVCLWGSPSQAQEDRANEPPAHISVVDGTAILERDGRRDTELMSMPLLSGDRLRTQAGRVEVLFADGSALHLDDNTVVDFQSDEVVRLLEGRVRLSVAGPARDLSYRIDAPSAWVQISTPGEYRVAILRDDGGGAGRPSRQRGARERAGAQLHLRRRTHVRPARLGAIAGLRFQFRRVGCLRSLVGGAARSAARCVRTVPARGCQALRTSVRHVRQLALRTGLWLRLVSPCQRRLAAVLPRPLGEPASLRLDLDRRRSVGLAHSPLRPLGLFERGVVSGFREERGDRRGCRGPTHRGT